jgi:hypothetical protein
MEAEYIAAYYAAQDIVWFRALLSDLDLQDPNIPTTLYSSTRNLLAPWPTTQFTMLGPSTSMSSSTGSVNRF